MRQPEPRDTHPVTFRVSYGAEKFPLTEDERAAHAATRTGGHAKFTSVSKITGLPVRKFDHTVGMIHKCGRCFRSFYDTIGTDRCDACRQPTEIGVD